MIKISILCKMKIHSWYRDSAWFNAVNRCRRCGKPEDQKADEKLQKERELWDLVPKELSMSQQIGWIRGRLNPYG